MVKVGISDTERWKDLHPVLKGSVLRFISGIGFSDLNDAEVAAIADVEDHAMQVADAAFEGFRDYIASELRSRKPFYETYLRTRFEGHLSKCSPDIDGFAEFTRSPSEYPLSARLCAEWLERFVDLPFEIERQMTECIFYLPQFEGSVAADALRQIAEQRLARGRLVTPQPKSSKSTKERPAGKVTPLHAGRKKQEDDWHSYWTALLCVLDSMQQRGGQPFLTRSKVSGFSY